MGFGWNDKSQKSAHRKHTPMSVIQHLQTHTTHEENFGIAARDSSGGLKHIFIHSNLAFHSWVLKKYQPRQHIKCILVSMSEIQLVFVEGCQWQQRIKLKKKTIKIRSNIAKETHSEESNFWFITLIELLGSALLIFHCEKLFPWVSKKREKNSNFLWFENSFLYLTNPKLFHGLVLATKVRQAQIENTHHLF